MGIAEILQSLIDSVDGMNPTRLARETGVPQPTIRRILVGESVDPDTETLQPLAARFGKAVAQLRGEIPLDVVVSTTGLPPGKYLFPRAYENVVVAQGNGRFNEDYQIEVEGSIPVPADLIVSRGWRIERLKVVKTDGMSMFPTLGENEPVVVNLDETNIINSKIYAIEDADEGARIKRLTKLRDGRILVRSDNQDKLSYPDDHITPDSTTRVVGRACYRSGEI